MFDSPSMRSIPRAHRDPLHSPLDALLLIMFLLDPSGPDETLIVMLDDERRGTGIMRVTNTTDPDHLLGVVDHVVEQCEGSPDGSAIIIAGTRTAGGIDVEDLALWNEADATCDDAGIELVEWFVIGNEVLCPRKLCGVASRWLG